MSVSLLPDSLYRLLRFERGWVVLVVSNDPRTAANLISTSIAKTLGLSSSRISPSLSNQDVESFIDRLSVSRPLLVVGDIASHTTVAIATLIRSVLDSRGILILGTESYESMRAFANKVSLIIDDRIQPIKNVPTKLVDETINLVNANSVESAANRARQMGCSEGEAMQYILLPQVLLRNIHPQKPQSVSAAPQQSGKQPNGENGDAIEQIFEALPLTFVNEQNRNRSLPILRSERGQGSVARRGKVSQQIDHSRARSNRTGHFSLFHTLLASAPYQSSRRAASDSEFAVLVEESDIRRYPFMPRLRKLSIVVIDSSGSMAASSRIRFAKGLVADLLTHSYRHRSYVSLIAARGQHATVLLKPTRSVAQAHVALRSLPTGGKTPLGSALEEALRVIEEMNRRHGASETEIILITDGKSNIESRSGVQSNEFAPVFQRRNIQLTVVDLVRANPSAVRFAETLGARYTFYPRGEASSYLA